MIIYLHGFNATEPENQQKMSQLASIDQDVRIVNYSTIHPKHDMSHILKEVDQHVKSCEDKSPLIFGVGLGAYWCERIGFLCGIKQVIFNPNLHPEDNMVGKIEWPEEYSDIATKCVTGFRRKNANNCLCIIEQNDNELGLAKSEAELKNYYPVLREQSQDHKSSDLSNYLAKIKAFKAQ